MLKAAAVGKIVIDNLDINVDTNAILQALLLHDMGNIIKFDLENFSSLLGNQLSQIEKWKKIQKEFILKYGNNEHIATCIIAKEIGVSLPIYSLIKDHNNANAKQAAEKNDFNLKICFYGDLRVGPFGVLSINKRFEELLVRYKNRNHPIANIAKTEENRKYTLEIEKQIQKHSNILLSTITNEKIESIVKELKTYVILN